MRAALALCALTCAACDAGERLPTTWFAEMTAESGLDFVHDAGVTPERHLPETMGAGCALVDVDGDGDLDLYLVQGGPLPAPGGTPGSFQAPACPRPPNRLYLNDGAGRFSDHTAASGAAADPGYGMGVAAGDVNGDGHVDLFVTNLGPDVLLLGDGTGSFLDGTAASGIRGGDWTSGATLLDADGDGDLDLYVCAYVLIDLARPEWCGDRRAGWRSYCHPDRYPGLEDRFWRNRGDGSFEDVTRAAGLGGSAGKGLGAIATDYDGDGDLDLYVANDSTENRLWENDGTGVFRDATLLSGTGVDAGGLTEAGMGLACGDVDADGDGDLFVTNFDDESNTLYLNEGAGLFADRTAQAGLEGPSRKPVGFGAVLADFDGDGDLDLAVANGHIIDNIHLYHDAKSHAQRAQLFENDGRGRFAELTARAGALTTEPQVGRSLVAGDLDGDGDLDLVLTVCNGAARVFRNQCSGDPGLVLRGLPAGTRVTASTRAGGALVREAGPQPSYLGQCSPWVHLPGGSLATLRLELRPPGGAPQTFELSHAQADGELAFELGADGLRLK
jgi:hypothetical protein